MRILSGELKTLPYDGPGTRYAIQFVIANKQTNDYVFHVELKLRNRVEQKKIYGVRIEKRTVSCRLIKKINKQYLES